MKEKLERFAELVNERWPETEVSVITDEPGVADVYLASRGWAFLPEYEDNANPEFIIWCLDRLEELGLDPDLCSNSGNGYYIYSATKEQKTGDGKTRAEACFEALLAALEEK